MLGALTFAASVSPSEVLEAVVLLQARNAEGRRHAPDDAPIDFVPTRWRPYLDAARATGDQNLFKHYCELCVLFALQGGLRSGEIWVQGSRRYADPASYLIAVETWPPQRAEVLELTGMPANFTERLTAIDEEMSRYLEDLEALLADPDGAVSVDADGQLYLKALTAEVIDHQVLAQRNAVVARLPRVPLTQLLIEVDRESGFSLHLTHAGGASPRHPGLEHRGNLYAAILSLACNFGSTRMADVTGISAAPPGGSGRRRLGAADRLTRPPRRHHPPRRRLCPRHPALSPLGPHACAFPCRTGWVGKGWLCRPGPGPPTAGRARSGPGTACPPR